MNSLASAAAARPTIARLVTFLLLVMLFSPMEAIAQSDPGVTTLKGVHKVVQVIETLHPELVSLVDTLALRQAVELKLREHGIRPLPADSLGLGVMLYLDIGSTYVARAGTWGLSAHIEVEEFVTPHRQPEQTLLTATWEGAIDTGIATDGEVSDEVRSMVSQELDLFLNAWLEANPNSR